MDSGEKQATQPTNTSQTTSNIPDWAIPYATRNLGNAEDLTNINKNPYQTYKGERVAGFNPLQQQAFANVAGMQSNAGTGNAMNQTQDAYNRSANAGQYNAQNFGNQYGSGPQFQNYGGQQNTFAPQGGPQQGIPSLMNQQQGQQLGNAAQNAMQKIPEYQQLEQMQQNGMGNSPEGRAQMQQLHAGLEAKRNAMPEYQAFQQFSQQGQQQGQQPNAMQQGSQQMGLGGLGGSPNQGEMTKGLGYLSTNSQNLNQYQMGPAQQVQNQGLNQYQMGPADQVNSQNFGQQSAQDYMSPYAQQAIDPTLRENQRQFDVASTGRQAAATRAGAFGGSRQAIEQSEAQRNLGRLQSDTQAVGMQNAYQNAQQQFNADQARRQQSQQSNQQAGLTTGQANLGSSLQTQGLGAQQNLQSQIANQQAGLTTGQANLGSSLQTQGLGSGQNLQSQQLNQAAQLQAQGQGLQQSLASNQQGMQNAQLRAQYGFAGQQAGEQSRQFGANFGLQNRQQALAAAGQLGTLGQQQYAQQMGINSAQQQAGAQQQAQTQQGLSNSYQDFLNQQNYPYKQIGFMSDILRGTPTSGGAQTMYQQPASSANALAGILGAGYAGSKLMGAAGGTVRGYAQGGMVDSIGLGLGAYALGRT